MLIRVVVMLPIVLLSYIVAPSSAMHAFLLVLVFIVGAFYKPLGALGLLLVLMDSPNIKKVLAILVASFIIASVIVQTTGLDTDE